MAINAFPTVPKPQCLPGKEHGVFARYDTDGRELIYIGLDDMVMHRDVVRRIEADWDRCFGETATKDHP